MSKQQLSLSRNTVDKEDDDESSSDDYHQVTMDGEVELPTSPTKKDGLIRGKKQAYGLVQTGEENNTADAEIATITIDDAIELLGNGRFQNRILLAAGLCFAADSMEVLLLSFLTVVLQAEWGLSDAQTNSITSSVFIGALCGTLILGPLGDRMGRKPVFVLTAAIICLFGFLTAAANNFVSLLVCRFLVGFGVGGLTIPFDTLAEFVPTSHRGTNLLAIEYFWTAGTLMVPVLAYISLGQGGGKIDTNWRYFVVLCAIPCLISTFLGLIYVPESPRWLLSKGRHEEAVSILQGAAMRNGKQPQLLFPTGKIRIIDEEEEGDSNCCDLLAPTWRTITLKLWGTWSCFAFLYYGTIIAVTLVFADDNVDNENGQLYSFDYAAIFASASAELAGTTFIILLVDRVGRIAPQAASYFFGGVSVFVLCILEGQDAPNRGHLICFAFFARMFFMSASCATWVSTAEILTTEIRTTGHSAANAVARLSGAAAPFVVSRDTSFQTIGIVILIISLLAFAFSWSLPETKGKSLGSLEHHHKNRNKEPAAHPFDDAVHVSAEQPHALNDIT